MASYLQLGISVLIAVVCLVPAAVAEPLRQAPDLPQPTHSGYLPLGDVEGNSLFFSYYEAMAPSAEDVPIILWLQGGPGCASSFGGLYELGPMSLTPDMQLMANPGAWNRHAGLLLVDQPLGTGLSFAASNTSIPIDVLGASAQLYTALWAFFQQHAELQRRPLFVTGESYAGHWVPSFVHFVLQVSGAPPTGPGGAALRHTRQLPGAVPPPNFWLAGAAIGNGLTEPRSQTLTLASSAWAAGLVSTATRQQLQARAERVVQLMDAGEWREAHRVREELRSIIVNVTGLATMFDTRRAQDYDPTKSVDVYLNLPEVRAALAAKPEGEYAVCSAAVRDLMAADIMRPVAYLVPDILDRTPLLLYQGQYDILDGPASNAAWLEQLQDWAGLPAFLQLNSTLWSACEAAPAAPAALHDSTRGQQGTRSLAAQPHQAAAGPPSLMQKLAAAFTRILPRLHSAGVAVDHAPAAAPALAAVQACTAASMPSLREVLQQRWQEQCCGAAQGSCGPQQALRWGPSGPGPMDSAAGWVRSHGRLVQAVVYKAGHMVPHDQPVAALHLLESWIAHALQQVQPGSLESPCLHA